jgi:predicted glycosyltransferase
LDQNGFHHSIIGKHPGKNKIRKVISFGERIIRLFNFLKGKRIDVAISHSSFFSPVVAKLLKIRVLYLNDNEHAFGNRLSFIFADLILVPEYLDLKKVTRQWAKPDKIMKYPGLKEGIYLWNFDTRKMHELKAENENKKIIFIRPEPWMAQYYRGEKNFLDSLIIDLKDRFKIILLPRGKIQEEYYQQEKFNGICIPEKSIRLSEIIEKCDLFIGAGGTMTREAAVLGIPTISTYQDKLLDVDRFLIKQGAMIHETKLNADFVNNFLEKNAKREPDISLLKKGKDAYDLIGRKLIYG